MNPKDLAKAIVIHMTPDYGCDGCPFVDVELSYMGCRENVLEQVVEFLGGDLGLIRKELDEVETERRRRLHEEH